MEQQGRANPAVYSKLREHALTLPLPANKDRNVQMIVMDWHLTSGTASVVVAFDGSASVYLSNGGGFIGGGQKSAAVRAAAMRALKVAEQALANFQPVSTADLPERGNVYFYARTESGLLRAEASEKALSEGTDAMTALGGAMQTIITQYRLIQSMRTEAPKSNS
jgi:hypothetical protein